MSPGAASKYQVGNVRARDEQHESDRAEQDYERKANVARELILKRNQGRATSGVGFGILAFQLFGYARKVSVRLMDAHAGLEPPDGSEEMSAAHL